MTNLKTVPRRVLKKDCIVAGNFPCWSLDIARSGPPGDISQSVYFGHIRRPKSNPALVGDMPGRLRDTKKFCRPVISSTLILDPTLNFDLLAETECWQEGFIKRANLCQISHSQVDMVKTTHR